MIAHLRAKRLEIQVIPKLFLDVTFIHSIFRNIKINHYFDLKIN